MLPHVSLRALATLERMIVFASFPEEATALPHNKRSTFDLRQVRPTIFQPQDPT
jgi:hypothetical protein